MDRTVDRLRCEWVPQPREEWVEDLESLAEGYPFEKERRRLQEIDPVRHLHQSLAFQDGRHQPMFLAAFFRTKLVGWLSVRKNALHSRHLPCSLYEGEWELIQRNRDDIRGAMLDQVKERFFPDVVHFQQPAQNRTARACFATHPCVVRGNQEIILARTDLEDLAEVPVPDSLTLVDTSTVSESALLRLLMHYRQSRLHQSPVFTRSTVQAIYRDWFLQTRKSALTFGRALIEENRPVGMILCKRTPSSFPSGKLSGTVQFLQVQPSHQGKKFGSLLLRQGINELRKQGVQYVEIKLYSQNLQALSFYRKHGFEPVTKRRHFYLLDRERVELPF